MPPFGTHDERGNPRKPSDHDTLPGIVRTLPTAMDCWGQSRVLETIRSTAVDEPVSFTLDTAGLAHVGPTYAETSFNHAPKGLDVINLKA